MNAFLRRQLRLFAMVSAITCASTLSSTAQAEILSAESAAYGVNVNLGIGLSATPLSSIVSAGLGPAPVASGTAPTAYNNSNDLASASVNGQLSLLGLGLVDLISFDTGILDVNAQSNVDGTSGSKTTSASATVNNVSLANAGVLGLLVQSIVSLDATVIQSSAVVSGNSGALVAAGTSTIAGAHGVSGNQALLTVLGVEFLLESSPAANTSILHIDNSVLGLGALQGSIDVILNEQVVTGDMDTTAGISVNALTLRFNNLGVNLGLLGVGLLNGELIIGHSEASMLASAVSAQPVPEPGSMALLACGICSCAGYKMRRRQLAA